MAARKKPAPPPSRSQDAIDFVEEFCKIPEGMFVGQKLVLDEFQKKFYRDLFNEKRKIRRAIWSMAKKNAKTTTIATLVLVYLVGPEAQQNSQIVSGAMSREQAALVFDICCKMIRLSPELSSLVRIIPSRKTLIGVPMNVTYVAVSAEAKTAQGKSPLVLILDELGQVRGPRSDFYDALHTAQGAHANPVEIIISTQAADDSDLLSILIDDAIASNDPATICHLYAAPDGCSLMDEKAWAAANPALGKFRSIDDVREQATQAVRMPSAEANFRNLILNQRISTNSPLIARSSWKACAGEPYPLEECSEIYAGIDLSTRTDLTALVLLGLHDETQTWNAYCHFWTPEQGLIDRAKRDRAPYDLWVQKGLIKTTPGAVVDYEWVAHEIADICAPHQLLAMAYDRWRIEILKKEFSKIGIELPLQEWGQGYKDMSPAIDAVENMILNKTLRHGGNAVLTMCAANAIAVRDPAGNRKLDKIKSTGRIDGFQALAQAAGIAERVHEPLGDLNAFISNPLVL